MKGSVRIIWTASETATEQKGARTRKLSEPDWQPTKEEAEVAGRHEARMRLGGRAR